MRRFPPGPRSGRSGPASGRPATDARAPSSRFARALLSTARPVSGCPDASDGCRSDGGADSRAAPPRRRSDNGPYSSPRYPFVTGERSQGELVFRNDADGGRTDAYMAPEESPDRTGLSPRTLSTARSNSVIGTVSRSSRIANMPASVQIAWLSAPVAPSQRDASTP